MHPMKQDVKGAPTANQKISQRVAALLGDRSAAWLGAQAGMSRAHAWRLLQGDVEWKTDSIERVATALGVRMADLMPDAHSALSPEEQAILAVFRVSGHRGLIALAVAHLPDP